MVAGWYDGMIECMAGTRNDRAAMGMDMEMDEILMTALDYHRKFV